MSKVTVTKKAKETLNKVMTKIKEVPINAIPSLGRMEEIKESKVGIVHELDVIAQRFNEIAVPNNWDTIDPFDKQSWDKLISQFWVDTRIPVSKDMADYDKLSDAEQVLMQRVFTGLTMLDTIQAEDGALTLLNSGMLSEFETANVIKIGFDETIHNKSYSTIFQTLVSSSKQISEIFQWSLENEYLQYKAKRIQQVYTHGTFFQKIIASALLEGFLFYSGFYLPVLWRGSNKMMNVSEVISLILRDESTHLGYLAKVFQKKAKKLTKQEREDLHMWATELLFDLYTNELKYTEDLYDEVGYTDDVKVYIRYRANVVFGALGFPPIFSETASDVNPIIIKGIRTTSTNHDFFSTVGNSYFIGLVESVKEEDFDIINDLSSRDRVAEHIKGAN